MLNKFNTENINYMLINKPTSCCAGNVVQNFSSHNTYTFSLLYYILIYRIIHTFITFSTATLRNNLRIWGDVVRCGNEHLYIIFIFNSLCMNDEYSNAFIISSFLTRSFGVPL